MTVLALSPEAIWDMGPMCYLVVGKGPIPFKQGRNNRAGRNRQTGEGVPYDSQVCPATLLRTSRPVCAIHYGGYMEKTVRLQVEVTESVMAELERLMESGGLKTKKDLLNTAFTLLKWAVRERALGNSICSVNEQSLLRKELEMPFLEAVATSERARVKQEKPPMAGVGVSDERHPDAMATATTAPHGATSDVR